MDADALSRRTISSVFHVEEGKNDLVDEVHKLATLGVRFEDTHNGDYMVNNNPESSLVVEVNSKEHLDQILMELKELVLIKLNESFSWGDGVHRYQGRLCVPDVDNLRGKVLEEAHVSQYSIHLGATTTL